MSDSSDGEPDANGRADVLLVEDNPGDVRLTEEAFDEGRFDATIHVATDGVEAIDFLHRRGGYENAPRPDVVLLDINLPRKNGDDVLEEVRADPDLASIPVVVLTSSAAEADVVKMYELGANAYLTKPTDPVDFIDDLRSVEEFWLATARLPDRDD